MGLVLEVVLAVSQETEASRLELKISWGALNLDRHLPLRLDWMKLLWSPGGFCMELAFLVPSSLLTKLAFLARISPV